MMYIMHNASVNCCILLLDYYIFIKKRKTSIEGGLELLCNNIFLIVKTMLKNTTYY